MNKVMKVVRAVVLVCMLLTPGGNLGDGSMEAPVEHDGQSAGRGESVKVSWE